MFIQHEFVLDNDTASAHCCQLSCQKKICSNSNDLVLRTNYWIIASFPRKSGRNSVSNYSIRNNAGWSMGFDFIIEIWHFDGQAFEPYLHLQVSKCPKAIKWMFQKCRFAFFSAHWIVQSALAEHIMPMEFGGPLFLGRRHFPFGSKHRAPTDVVYKVTHLLVLRTAMCSFHTLLTYIHTHEHTHAAVTLEWRHQYHRWQWCEVLSHWLIARIQQMCHCAVRLKRIETETCRHSQAQHSHAHPARFEARVGVSARASECQWRCVRALNQHTNTHRWISHSMIYCVNRRSWTQRPVRIEYDVHCNVRVHEWT